VTARDVIREGITNSIQAGASEIFVDLGFEKHPDLFDHHDRNFLGSIPHAAENSVVHDIA
jgi:hypothetical protein